MKIVDLTGEGSLPYYVRPIISTRIRPPAPGALGAAVWRGGQDHTRPVIFRARMSSGFVTSQRKADGNLLDHTVPTVQVRGGW